MKHWLLLALLFTNTGYAQQQTPYSFFVAGHVSGENGVNNPGVHPPFKAIFPQLNADTTLQFGVFAGDIVSPFPVEQDWIEVDADVSSLNMPVHFVVGNHDMENRPLFEQRYGATYSTFLFGGDLFFLLDSDLDGWSIESEQLEMIYDQVALHKDSVDNIFVITHHLLWFPESEKYGTLYPNSLANLSDTPNFWTTIEPFFYNLAIPTFFIAGDVGATSWSADFVYDSYDNITLVATGMGKGQGENFLKVHKNESGTVEMRLHCLDSALSECHGSLSDHRLTTDVIHLYPNPSEGFFRIGGVDKTAYARISVINAHGKQVHAFTSAPNTPRIIDLSGLSQGVYFVSIETEQGVFHTSCTLF